MKYSILFLSLLNGSVIFSQTNPLHPQSEEDEISYKLASVIDSINSDRIKQIKKIDSISNEYRITLLELNQKKIENEILRQRYHQEEMIDAKQNHLEWQNRNLKNKFYGASVIAAATIISGIFLVFKLNIF